MALTVDELFDAALGLPIEDLRDLTTRLLKVLDPAEQAEIERAWVEVAKQRIEDYRAGRITARPAADIFDELRSGVASDPIRRRNTNRR